MEIIAKKKLNLIILCLFGALGFVAYAIIEMFFLKGGEVYKMLLLIIALSGFLIFLIIAIIVAKPPYVIITYADGVLRFADGLRCAPYELEKVHYRRAFARGWQFRWGTLIVTVNGEDHKFRYIANVMEVHDRLVELKLSTLK